MVKEIRRLLGRVDLRALIVLVSALTLTAVLLSFAQVTTSPAQDLALPVVSSWAELVEMYLAAREREYPLAIPIWSVDVGSEQAIGLDDLAALQNDPDWYWTSDNGGFCFDEKSKFGKGLKDGTEVVIYEDMANEEVLVLIRVKEEDKDYQEEIVCEAPPWPPVEEDYDAYLWRQLSKRRIVWRVTLKSASKAAEEAEAITAAAEASALLLESGLDGGGIMTMGARGGSNDLWLSIERLPDAWSNGVDVTIHLPVGYTNAVEIYTFDANENAHFAGVPSSPWVLAMGSSETAGTNLIVWTDTSVTGTLAR
ncbi:MAG: hypothetical protein JXB04_00645, partial [Kiritimatiellae bacterium]|nr:hypothetical protein [Kiritimatiellia bacterium]